MKKEKGMTLIEVIVVAGIIASTMTVLTLVVNNVFSSKSRVEQSSKINEIGSEVIKKMSKLMFEAEAESFNCQNPDRIIYTSRLDGGVTTILCANSKIASQSASQTIDLTPDDINVIGCTSFVSNCQSGVISPSAEIKFGVRAVQAGTDEGSTVTFKQKIVVR
jgi:prepilin-type N-terminal cleavage/methylation domain-containing protein